MSLDIRNIKMPLLSEPVTLKITAEEYPQAIVGKVWRYLSDKSPDGAAGNFKMGISKIPLGMPNSVDRKFFLIQGVVLAQNDTPPTPYSVAVTLLQGNQILHQEIPKEGGSGHISDKDIPFMYRFTLEG